MRYAILLDLEQCVGCEACTVACKLDNRTSKSIKWGRIIEEESGAFPDVTKIYAPMLCMQCENPQCVEVCPTGASYRRPDGLVLVDPKKCMGCKFCIIACPYMERYTNPKGYVEKCDFCVDRLDEKQLPVCVETCPYGARIFGDLDDSESEISRRMKSGKTVALKGEEIYRPRMRYLVTH